MRPRIVHDYDLTFGLQDTECLMQRAAVDFRRLLMQQEEKQHLIVAAIRQLQIHRIHRERLYLTLLRQLPTQALELNRQHIDDVERPVFGRTFFCELRGQIAIGAGRMISLAPHTILLAGYDMLDARMSA